MTDVIKNIDVSKIKINVTNKDSPSSTQLTLPANFHFAILDLKGVKALEQKPITLAVSEMNIKVGDINYIFTSKNTGNVKLTLQEFKIKYDGNKEIIITGKLTSQNDKVTEIVGDIKNITMVFDAVEGKTPTIEFYKDKMGGGSPQHKKHKKSRKARKGGRRQTRYARRNKK